VADGIVIGWQQIYDKMVALEATMHAFTTQQSTDMATVALRVSELEKDTAKLQTQRESDAAAQVERERQAERDRVQLRRMVWAALIGVLGSIMANLAPLLIHH
jgi:hypothetical protein